MSSSEPVFLPIPRRISWRDGPSNANVAAAHEGIDPARIGHPQGYQIEIRPDAIEMIAADAAGAFYARQTLAQLQRACAAADAPLPQGVIEDWPDFAARGVMLDISRDKVPTIATLYAIVDRLAELKLNQLQLYTEHTFAYSQHHQVWQNASPMTPEEIRALDGYCRERFIELVPNQNSFGHMERWLKHPRYAALAEKPDGFTFPWGTRIDTGFSLDPLDPRSLELIEGLYDELLPNFTSPLFNVGCDETFDIGLGKSKAECERRGKERVYLDFLLKIHDAVKRRGRTMQFWGDIILHKPELIGEMPKDVIALNWGYDADHPFENQTRAFADAKVPFYVCPGTSSWLSISGRSDNALANLRSAAASGLANGAIGYLNTDWGDLGHLQYWPVSELPIAAGAAYAWCYEANRDLDLPRALDLHVFRDRAGVLGKLMLDYGNVYQAVKKPMGNSSRLFWSLVGDESRRTLWEPITRAESDDAERRVDEILARLSSAKIERGDAELVRAEIHNGAEMLRHACRRGRWRLDPTSESPEQLRQHLGEIIAEHKRLWLARNRVGGLDDSVKQLDRPLRDYARG